MLYVMLYIYVYKRLKRVQSSFALAKTSPYIVYLFLCAGNIISSKRAC